jgi:heme O synthase-like polyprenyltransferase
VFSSVISYLLAPKVVEYDWKMIALLFIAGFMVTGSANAINQVVEKDTDAMMKRTAKRPVASGRMTEGEGWAFAIYYRCYRSFHAWEISLTGCQQALHCSVCFCMHLFIPR